MSRGIKSCDCKSEWQIILEYLVVQDTSVVSRICTKMIIFLLRKKNDEILDLLEDLSPSSRSKKKLQLVGPNLPNPKGLPFLPEDLIFVVFDIAAKELNEEQIVRLLKQWLLQENVNLLSGVLEKAHAPLSEVYQAIKRFLSVYTPDFGLSNDIVVGLRVGLIMRFLSDNLTYINIAKKYISIGKMAYLLNRTIGSNKGQGKFGGKSAGLILAYEVVKKKRDQFPNLMNVFTPRSRFLTSDGSTNFLYHNALEEFAYTKYQEAESVRQEFPFLEYIFKNSQFPPDIYNQLHRIIDDFEGKPVVIRSSSLLEDSFSSTFSGKYKSLFLANVGTREERLEALVNAITEVYASIFSPDPITYRKERGVLDFREEMGILIQEVVGTKIGKYYLPSFAGVAFSNNDYRWSNRLKREDGIVRIVAGLGTRAVDRTMDDFPILICPSHPNLRVNQSPEDTIKYSQKWIDVINTEIGVFETISVKELIRESGGIFPGIEKVFSLVKEGEIREPLSSFEDFKPNASIVTFNNLTTRTNFISTIKDLLSVLREAFGCPVDIEFASDGEKLYLLQCRPQSRDTQQAAVKIPQNISSKDLIFSSDKFVNNGAVEGIEYIIYVDAAGYSSLPTVTAMQGVGETIGTLNRILKRKSFILIGPGRWGSKGDIKLGVPVTYSDINKTAMLIEVAREKDGYVPELSFGTHFFQDLVEAGIKYLPLYPGNESNVFNEAFFAGNRNNLTNLIPEAQKFEHVIKVIRGDDIERGVRFKILMDSESSRSAAFISRENGVKN